MNNIKEIVFTGVDFELAHIQSFTSISEIEEESYKIKGEVINFINNIPFENISHKSLEKFRFEGCQVYVEIGDYNRGVLYIALRVTEW